jgi:hypothetical protein
MQIEGRNGKKYGQDEQDEEGGLFIKRKLLIVPAEPSEG